MPYSALASAQSSVGCGLPPCTNTARGRTVLLVDDDSNVLAMVSETLAAMGHKVITAHDGREALGALLLHRSIDYLFTDVVMPNGMTGMQLMTAARAVRPGLPALLASVRSRDEVLAMGDVPFDVEFIAKPYSLSDLDAHLKGAAKKTRNLAFVPTWGQVPPMTQAGNLGYLRVIGAAADAEGTEWLWRE